MRACNCDQQKDERGFGELSLWGTHGGMRRCRAGSIPLTECGAPSLSETRTPQLTLGLSELRAGVSPGHLQ